MAGKIAIFVASVVGASTLSGIALGNYATTARQPAIDATEVVEASTPPSSVDMSYAASVSDQTTDLTPDHVPVCYKGCGRTLSDRQSAMYFDDSSSQLDRIYGSDSSYDYAAAPKTSVSYEAHVAPVPPPKPRLTLGKQDVPCSASDAPDCDLPDTDDLTTG
ncbi:hypothetical protein C1T17_09905 [Sphingobium sp. SCG-1]|uniref:hypothetical protein n=1 Tax=Sphingobium sp. SCG-1 TaxID=2072936 RepID=UPI000CD6B06E|nr:hypothetical protein [Sphingobium sp. SCG-1]AUW58371.1 hypothetical protein C1T17_09905 [Sphingobium sp. SCG-1]